MREIFSLLTLGLGVVLVRAERAWAPATPATVSQERKRAISPVILLRLGKPLRKAGVFAREQTEVVVSNIACAINGKGPPSHFRGEEHRAPRNGRA